MGLSGLRLLDLPLALRTKMRAALGEDNALDGRAAHDARLAGAPENAVLILKAARLPAGP